MKAIRLHQYGSAQDLRVENIPVERPQPGQVLVRTHSAGVNPVDWKVRRGDVRVMIDPPLPIILGTEASGVIEALGEDVTDFAVGDEVIAHPGLWGCYAEFITLDAVHIVAKPKRLSFECAASVAMSVQTAWGAIVEAARPQPGETLLILGAAGGVGRAAVQIARMLGVDDIYGTSSSRNSEHVQDLGAKPIAYDAPGGQHFPDVDVLVDLVVGDATATALKHLRKGGRYISAVSPFDIPAIVEQGYDASFFGMSTNPDRMRKIVDKIEEGVITMADPIVFSFDQVVEAHALSESGHPASRIIMKPTI